MRKKRLIIGTVCALLLLGFVVLSSVQTHAEERLAASLFAEDTALLNR